MAVPLVRFVQDGQIVDYTPVGDTPAGTVVVQGSLVGVTKLDIRAGKLGAMAVVGIFDFPKTVGTGSGITVGTEVYWDAADGVATASANNGATPPVAYTYVGKTTAAAADADATVRVRLCP
jgi:predicted RecA/RadA family phage recombinase